VNTVSSRFRWWIGGWLALGIATRWLLQFPLHRYPADADCTLIGFVAQQILAGDPSIFIPTGMRLGSLSAYVMAATFSLVGAGREGLALAAFLVSVAQLFLWWRLLEYLVGREAGLIALPLVAVPTPAVAEWAIHRPNSNPEIFLVSAAILLLAARIERRGGTAGWLFALGFAVGVGFWASALTLGVSIPALIWLGWVRRDLLARKAMLSWLVAGGLLGASPWIAFNLRYSWASLVSNPALTPIRRAEDLLASLGVLFGYRLPQLLASPDGTGGAEVVRGPWSIVWLLAMAAPLFALAVLLVHRLRGAPSHGVSKDRRVLELAGMVAGAVLSLNLIASIGLAREPTVRYVLPIALVVPVVVALAFGAAGARTKKGILALVAASFLFNVSALHGPWDKKRQRWAQGLETNRRMVALLEGERVDLLLGPFWEVDSVVFDAGYRILGVPLEEGFDFRRSIDRLSRPTRWALVGSREEVRKIAERVGIEGTSTSFAGGRELLIAEPFEFRGADGVEILKALRSAGRD
jgi:hypothetical protein